MEIHVENNGRRVQNYETRIRKYSISRISARKSREVDDGTLKFEIYDEDKYSFFHFYPVVNTVYEVYLKIVN